LEVGRRRGAGAAASAHHRSPPAERYVKVEGKPLHQSCYKCTQCGKGLVGQPFGKGERGEIICEDCVHTNTRRANPNAEVKITKV